MTKNDSLRRMAFLTSERNNLIILIMKEIATVRRSLVNDKEKYKLI